MVLNTIVIQHDMNAPKVPSFTNLSLQRVYSALIGQKAHSAVIGLQLTVHLEMKCPLYYVQHPGIHPPAAIDVFKPRVCMYDQAVLFLPSG